MNRFFLLALILAAATLAACSVTSEKYRYQHRFDSFYNLLDREEASLFASNNLVQVAERLEKRMASDPKLVAAYRDAQTDEAILTFGVSQTVRFYREIILRELNRNNYYRFMNYLDAASQTDLVRRRDIGKNLESLSETNRGFRAFMDGLKKEYRLYGFSNPQITDFFRTVSFPELSRREFYPLLKLLRDTRALQDFRTGQTASAAQKLDQAVTGNLAARHELDAVRKRSGLTKMSTQDLLSAYYDIVMKEMDQSAVQRTLGKF